MTEYISYWLANCYLTQSLNCITYWLVNTSSLADPRLQGAHVGMKLTHLSCFTPSWIVLTESARETVPLPRLGTLSTLIFLVRARDCLTFMLHDLADVYVESVTAHRIKRNDHSCFHSRWPNSKTKLKLKHLWEQGGPWCFGGPTQLAYSAYREDRLCTSSSQ